MSRAYYNEHDPFAAEWLKILIVSGLIAEGDVDSRSIEDVRPNDLAGYTQCHFFAGIGGWSHALRLAGWPDSRPVWTGSCPCQPFSAAGKGIGFADERHLWPAFHWLIANCRPVTVFGEQVASKDGLTWLDTVYTDLENTGYAVGASDLCAAGIGAPHIRQRLYFRSDSTRPAWMRAERWGNERADTGGYGSVDNGVSSDAKLPNGRAKLEALSKSHGRDGFGGSGELGVNSDTLRFGLSQCGIQLWKSKSERQTLFDLSSSLRRSQTSNRVEGLDTGLQRFAGHERNWNKPGWLNESETRSIAASGATRGFWGDSDWWHGRDEKFRPIEPGIFPLAHGVSARVGRLRGYGNAIVPQLAAEFIKASEGI